MHRIDQCIPEMDSVKDEDSKWKINIKHQPKCALHKKCEMNEKPMKHDPGYTPTQHDLSDVQHDPGYTPTQHDLSDVQHDPGYTVAQHDLSDVHDWTVKADGDRNVDHPKKIIKTRMSDDDDDADDKTDEECTNQGTVTKSEQFINYNKVLIIV